MCHSVQQWHAVCICFSPQVVVQPVPIPGSKSKIRKLLEAGES